MIISYRNNPVHHHHSLKILLFIFFLFVHEVHAQEWELKRDKKGIKVYVRQSESSGIREYKAVMLVKTSVDAVLKILTDGDDLWKWNYRTVESRTVKTISDNEFVIWIKNNLPWPIKNRDHVSRVKVSYNENGSVIMTIDPETTYTVPEVSNSIRIEKFKGYWSLVPQGDYVEITQQLYGDPEGGIPTWLINSVIANAPYNSFLNLKEILEN